MRKFVCLIAIAILFQFIGCKDQYVDPIPETPLEDVNASSTEILDWDAAMEDPTFINLLAEFGDLESDKLILKGAQKSKSQKNQIR